MTENPQCIIGYLHCNRFFTRIPPKYVTGRDLTPHILQAHSQKMASVQLI